MAIAGPFYAVKAIRPLLVGVLARELISVGEDVSKASLLKTAGYVLSYCCVHFKLILR